ncbi:MAG: RNA polymerase sigma factor, partial [Pseudonocardiaceae bacterium]
MIHTVRDDPAVIALVKRAMDGDQAAWDRIVERYAALVWSVCRGFDLTGADADDVGASVWFRLLQSLGTIREPAALPGWIATTTRRECLHLLRLKKRQVPVADQDLVRLDVHDAGPGADEWLLVQERHIALRSAFAGLSQRCRQLLSLLF